MGTAELDGYVNVAELGGIEVYPDWMRAPPQYRPPPPASPCGAVLVWTKGALR